MSVNIDLSALYKLIPFFVYVDMQLFITAYILAPSKLLNLPIFCFILTPLWEASALLFVDGTLKSFKKYNISSLSPCIFYQVYNNINL